MSSERDSKCLKSTTDIQQDINDVCHPLGGPFVEESAETRMLRSRITEQSNLICVLKQQADEMLLCSNNLKKANLELEALRASVQSELENERKRCRQLEKRFMDLAANHRELINFKDEYKRQNVELVQENTRLRDKNEKMISKQLQEKEETIHNQTKQLMELTQEHRQLEREYQEKTTDFQEKLNELMNLHQVKEASLQDELVSTQNQLKNAVKMHAEMDLKLKQNQEKSTIKESKIQKKLETLMKEKNELLELSMKQGKILQNKQVEIQELEKQRQDAENAKQDAVSRFEREAAAVDGDLRVKELQNALHRAEEECVNLKKDFEAYKKHSSDLLQKEKELNAKLRHMII